MDQTSVSSAKMCQAIFDIKNHYNALEDFEKVNDFDGLLKWRENVGSEGLIFRYNSTTDELAFPTLLSKGSIVATFHHAIECVV